MKPDKAALVRHVLGGGKPFDFDGMHPKRMERVLEDWSRRGWWDYGVSLRTGWLTPLGRAKLGLAPITRIILAKECVERGLITTPEQYIRAVEGPKR